jgi:hypothetical protein
VGGGEIAGEDTGAETGKRIQSRKTLGKPKKEAAISATIKDEAVFTSGSNGYRPSPLPNRFQLQIVPIAVKRLRISLPQSAIKIPMSRFISTVLSPESLRVKLWKKGM